MRLTHYLTVLAAVIGLGIWVVGLHVERVRAGHRIHRLENERAELLRQRKEILLLLEEAATPEKLRALGVQLGIEGAATTTAGRPS